MMSEAGPGNLCARPCAWLAAWLLLAMPGVGQTADGDVQSQVLAVEVPEAQDALRGYMDLPPAERRELRSRMAAQVQSVASWVTAINTAGPGLLCLGENHGAPVRAFLAEHLFPRLDLDHLVLETSPRRARWLQRQARDGATPLRLLGADIGGPLAAALTRNPGLAVHGFERIESAGVGAVLPAVRDDRDERVARQLGAQYQAGERYAVLYGGLHCADTPLWMFHDLRTSLAPELAANLHAVRVIGDHQDDSVAGFAEFLRALGIADDTFVLVRTEATPAPVRTWFPRVDQYLLRPFDTLVVHRHEPPAGMRHQRLSAAEHGARDFPHWTAGGVTTKPSTDEPVYASRRSQWLDGSTVTRPSTADRGLSLRGDVFPHPNWVLPGRKPSTGDLDVSGGGDIFPHLDWDRGGDPAGNRPRILSPAAGDSRPDD